MNIKNKELNNYIKNKEYEKCNDKLEKYLIDYVVELIGEKKKDYKYTTIYSLIQASKMYINDERKNIASKIRLFSTQLDELDNIYRLLELCDAYKIKL